MSTERADIETPSERAVRLYEERADDEARLRATVSTLLARVESLERTVAGLKDRESNVRRAVGQLASSYDVLRK